MKRITTTILAGLFVFLSADSAAYSPLYIKRDLKELAEAALRCGKRTSQVWGDPAYVLEEYTLQAGDYRFIFAYAKPASLEDELKELAELAMKCGKKISYKPDIRYSFSPLYDFDVYSLDVPVNPDENKHWGLPVRETLHFRFIDGSPQKDPNRVIDEYDRFIILGHLGTATDYFECSYQHQDVILPRPCTHPFEHDIFEVEIHKKIQYIKERVPPECYGNIA